MTPGRNVSIALLNNESGGRRHRFLQAKLAISPIHAQRRLAGRRDWNAMVCVFETGPASAGSGQLMPKMPKLIHGIKREDNDSRIIPEKTY
jgi:hypothetical protein